MTAEESDLATLARVYYGQDWDIVVDSPEQVVDMFVDNRGATSARRAADQIRSILLDDLDESALEFLWLRTLRSSFSVPPTGMTYRQWFEHLRDLLVQATPSES